MRDLEHELSTTASPGDGVSPIPISSEPLATEGEATPGPDDVNPFKEVEDERVMDDGRYDADDELFTMVPDSPFEVEDPELPEF